MHEQQLMIAGPAGELESLLMQPAGWCEHDPIAICCHPHPLYGGTMQNKVVYTLAKACGELGASALRFNFRGVGQSEGEFAKGDGEQLDLLAVTRWLGQTYPAAPLWLCGFSFGAYVAAMAHSQIMPQRLALVAPAVSMYPAMQSLRVQVSDWILVQGGQDEVISSQAVMAWLKQQVHKPHLIWLEQAGHFFHGQLGPLREGILRSWKTSV